MASSNHLPTQIKHVSFLRYLAEMFIEPILLSGFLYVLYQRLQTLIESDEGTFWTRLEADMLAHMGLYWGFFAIIFLIWILYRAWKLSESRRQHNEIMLMLTYIANAIGGNTMPKSNPQPNLTKKRYEELLRKAAQPVSEWEPEKEASETLESHPSDGYSGKRKNQDKTGDKED